MIDTDRKKNILLAFLVIAAAFFMATIEYVYAHAGIFYVYQIEMLFRVMSIYVVPIIGVAVGLWRIRTSFGWLVLCVGPALTTMALYNEHMAAEAFLREATEFHEEILELLGDEDGSQDAIDRIYERLLDEQRR